MGKNEDMEKYAPFHISVAATVVQGGEERLWYSEMGDKPALNLSQEKAHELLEYLEAMQEQDYRICAWNGLGFDLKWIGHQADDMALAARIALKSYDPMFQFFSQAGFPVGLAKVAEAMGIEQEKLMDAAEAPIQWRAGNYQQVMDYVLGDCQMTNQIAQAIEEEQYVRWVTKRGTVSARSMPKLKTVEEVIQEPEPDQSWMDAPIPKLKFYEWTQDVNGSKFMNHSYEEVRHVIVDILAGRENTRYGMSQLAHLELGVGEVLQRRESALGENPLSSQDSELIREVFWDLFRQGAVMPGLDRSNPNLPFFSVTSYGKKILEGADPYFFYDSDTYETIIKEQVPDINETTLVYLKEAMQAFRSGCILSCSVMLGVATEHTFLTLIETIQSNAIVSKVFTNVSTQRTILEKVNKFKNILDQNMSDIPPAIKEDLDTHFASILSVIRNFRNQAGHPTGKVISREQAYVNMQIFIPYCKKIYQLRRHYSK